MPVIYELCVDITYPVAPSTSCNLINFVVNIGCLVFLLIDDSLNPKVSFLNKEVSCMQTLNWTVTGTAGLFSVLLIILKTKYERKLNK